MNFPEVDATGRVIPKVQKPEKPKPREFTTNEYLFYGAEVRTDSHPLVPPHRIVERYQWDDEPEHKKNTEDALKLMSMGRCVFFIGPHGTGKTETAKLWAAAARRPLYSVQGHAHFEWRDLTGRWTLRDGNSTFEYGPLVLAAQTGGLLLIDEAPSIKQGILNGLNDILNNLGKGLTQFPIAGAHGNEIIHVKEGFNVVLTGNPWDQYNGNNELNLAFLSRMHIREKWYLGEAAETRLLMNEFPNVGRDRILQLVQFANDTRQRWKSNRDAYRYLVCTRTLQNVCTEIEHLGASTREAIDRVIYSVVRLTDPDELTSLQQAANQRIRMEKV
jgi:cobaltochelatase CobS